MEKLLEEIHLQKDVFSQFCASKSTKNVSEALEQLLTFDKLQQLESDPAWNNISEAVIHRQIDKDQTHIVSEIAQYLVDISGVNLVNIHLLNSFSDHIWQLGSICNATSELPTRGMMNFKQAYHQSYHCEAAFQTVQTQASKEVCYYGELNANEAKECRDYDMFQTKSPIKLMTKNVRWDIKMLDCLAKWCAIPKRKLQDLIAWGF